MLLLPTLLTSKAEMKYFFNESIALYISSHSRVPIHSKRLRQVACASGHVAAAGIKPESLLDHHFNETLD